MTDNDPNRAANPSANRTGQEPVASGDRRDVHYEADRDQLVVARSTARPDGPLPPEDQRLASGAPPPREGTPIEDVRVTPEEPSVWDARPPADDAEKSGNPTGH